MHFRKRILSFVLVFSMMFACFVFPAAAADTDAADTTAADLLYGLGLFSGTGTNEDGTPIYSLEKQPTRAQAITMLVNLLGKAGEAKAGTWVTPFTDVPSWAQPFVGYAYANGLTSGVSATQFGSDTPASASMYLTFVLKALGYTAGTDFIWSEAWKFADQLGITSGEYGSGNAIDRGDVVKISESALVQNLKDTDKMLVEKLDEENAVDETAVDAYLQRPIAVKGVIMDVSSISVEAGKEYPINAAAVPETATDKSLTWKTSNADVATVENGVVYGVAEGTAVVTATASNGISCACKVSVYPSTVIATYSGTGDEEITGIQLPKGPLYIEYTYEGEGGGSYIFSNFSIKFYNDYYSSCQGEGRRFTPGTSQLYISNDKAQKNARLKINSDEKWTVSIKRFVATVQPMTQFSGYGDTVISCIVPETDVYAMHTTSEHDYPYGRDFMNVNFYDLQSGSSGELTMVTDEDAKDIVQLKTGKQYIIVIETDCEWTLDFAPSLYETTSADYETLTFSGTGNEIIPGIDLPEGKWYCETTYNGEEHEYTPAHYVRLYDHGDNTSSSGTFSAVKSYKCGTEKELLENFHSGKETITVTNGFLSVDSEGAWTVRFIKEE